MYGISSGPVWAAVVVLAGTAAASAAETETRTFAVAVDGKPAGTCRLTLQVGDDGGRTFATAVDIKIRAAVFKYTYSFRGREVWAGDRVAAVETACDDNGKKKSVRATAGDGGLTVVAGGAARKVAAEAVPSSGWYLPDPKARGIVLLDSEDGTETPVRVDPLGACQVVVNGAVVAGQKYKLTGKGVDAEWWFDAAGRPVRQSLVSDGHKVVTTLVEVAR